MTRHDYSDAERLGRKRLAVEAVQARHDAVARDVARWQHTLERTASLAMQANLRSKIGDGQASMALLREQVREVDARPVSEFPSNADLYGKPPGDSDA
jgi:hypothetical protein